MAQSKIPPQIQPAQATTILVVDDERLIRNTLSQAIELFGYQVLQASDGEEALEILVETPPDLILLDIMMPNMDGRELLRRLRSHTTTQAIPVILLTALSDNKDIVEGLELGADDYLTKAVDLDVLHARIRAKLSQVARTETNSSVQGSIYSPGAFMSELERELVRMKNQPPQGFIASIELHELERLTDWLGQTILPSINKQVQAQILLEQHPLEILTIDSNAHFLLLMPESTRKQAKARLTRLSERISGYDFMIKNERIRFTPIIGFTALEGDLSVQEVMGNLNLALEDAQRQIDLDPKLYLSTRRSRFSARLDHVAESLSSTKTVVRFGYLQKHARTILQIGLTFFIGIGLPFLLYLALWAIGIDITQVVYIGVVIALLLTAFLIWFEGFLATRQDTLPEPAAPYPLCSAIIAAYLPNEADTLTATIDAFLNLDYPGPIQVVLAYNTPYDMPIEETLRALAKRDPRFQPMRFEHSTSKAQNVNAAIEHVTGEFVGIFDADHQPSPDTFTRAWRWLSQGYDVVQGHCLIRNGATNWLARLVAVEFEAIYAVAHPGRARMHGFGIFGGSNGYWRADILHEIRMHGFMLTEDIDSSMRITKRGYKIKVDPHIISRELSPTSLPALWNQRMRWAQGWFQVSVKHAFGLLLSRDTTIQQKLGIWHLVVWREIYPWISMQIIPIVMFWVVRNGGFHNIDWFVPIFVVTSIVTLSTGPAQIYYIYRLSHESLKPHRSWYLFYTLVAFFYVEYKNTIARVAQVKELLGERRWRTTPRT